MKRIVRITENDLHKIVRKSVSKLLKEGWIYGNDGLESDGSDSIDEHPSPYQTDINECEVVPIWEVLNQYNIDNEVYNFHVFDKKGNCVGEFGDLTVRYDPNIDKTI